MTQSSTLKNNIFGSILLIAVIVMEVNISLQQHCLPPVNSQTGYALVGKEYKSFIADDYPVCLMACKNDERCMSLNYLLTTKKCDLNTQTKESQPKRYKMKQNSIYSTNTAFRTPEPEIVKGMKELPAKSCLDILVSGESVGTGVYWIDPANTGSPIQAYCDMTTDGGGWTIVKKTILQSANLLPHEILATAYEVIAAHDRKDKWILPKVDAILGIHQKMGFHQIHFYCRKQSVGRVVSIMTKKNTAGQQVVGFFTTPGAASVFPEACGSFERLPEDMSILAQKCSKWGTSEPAGSYPPLLNQWGYYSFHGPGRLGAIPFQMDLPPKHFFGSGMIDGVNKAFCDDSIDDPQPYNANDKWQISVR